MDDLQHYLSLAAERHDRILDLETRLRALETVYAHAAIESMALAGTLTEALEFYANPANYKRPGPDGFPLASRVESDGGRRARQALHKEDGA